MAMTMTKTGGGIPPFGLMAAGTGGAGGPKPPGTGPASPNVFAFGPATAPAGLVSCRLRDLGTPDPSGAMRRFVVVSEGKDPSIVAPRREVGENLSLALIAASSDQTTYWPDEAV